MVDPAAKKVTERCDEAAKLKDVVQNQQFIALMFKKGISIYTKTLHKIASIEERINVKSLIWHDSFLLYTTKAQIKFMLLNGDSGVIKSTENIIYLAKAIPIGEHNYNAIGMDNRGQLVDMQLNLSEVVFKQALYDKDIPLI